MTGIGNAFAYDITTIMPNSEVVFRGSTYRITLLSERLIRFEYSKSGTFYDEKTTFVANRNFPKPAFDIIDNDKNLFISTRYFKMNYTKEKSFKGTAFSPEANLKVELLGTDKVWYYNHPEARNFKGSTVSLDDVNNSSLSKGLYSVDGFVSFDDSNNNIINKSGYIQKKEEDNIDLYLFIYKKDFGLCLADYFNLTSHPPLLPKYALGIWWNRDRIYNSNDVLKMSKLFNKYDIPFSVMLLSEFWHTKNPKDYNLHKTGYTFDPALFPNPKELVKTLHNQNVHLGINLDPGEGVTTIDPAYSDFAKNFVIDNKKNIPLYIYDVDFINKFMSSLINPLNEIVDFFWVDYLGDKNILNILNYYLFNSFKSTNDKRPLIMSRNANVAAHKYGIHYSGETIVDFKTLNYLPWFNSTASNIGLSWWSHDVGGFKGGIEDSELYSRYVQYSCFSPIFRFSAKRGPYYKREPWLWDAKTLTIVKKYCHLRYKLIPYLYSENYKYHKTGIPLSQPLYYITPEVYDEPLYKNEYYFGSEFLIAPITKPRNLVMNRSVERIFLPEGVWYDFETGKKFIGNKRYVTFFKEESFPAFVKAGAIVPLSVLPENKNDISNPKNLEINIFPGKSNSYNLYEDDGISNSHENGEYHITSIDYNYMANNYTVIIRPLEGKSGVIPALRNYMIKFRNTKEASNVSVFINGDKATNKIEKSFDDVDFTIKIYDVDVTKQLTINCKGSDIEINTSRIINEDINLIIHDLKINTDLKEKIANIIFSKYSIKKKRIEIRKLRKDKLDYKFINMFLNLLEFMADI